MCVISWFSYWRQVIYFLRFPAEQRLAFYPPISSFPGGFYMWQTGVQDKNNAKSKPVTPTVRVLKYTHDDYDDDGNMQTLISLSVSVQAF